MFSVSGVLEAEKLNDPGRYYSLIRVKYFRNMFHITLTIKYLMYILFDQGYNLVSYKFLVCYLFKTPTTKVRILR